MSQSASRTAQRSWVTLAVALSVPLLLAVAAYTGALDGDFQHDDVLTVQTNRRIRNLSPFLGGGVLRGAIRGERSLTDLTFALDYRLAGLNVTAFHLTNVALHLVAIVLIYFFTRRVLTLARAPESTLVPLVVAGIFALHPVQTEAVAYISQRSEVLASVLYLGSLLLLFKSEELGRSRWSAVAYAAALALFVLGFGAKIIVATLPVAYLAAGWMLPPQDETPRVVTGRGRLLRALPLLAYVPVPVLSSLHAMKGADAGFSVPGLPPSMYFLTEWRVLISYLRLLLCPIGQNVDWDVTPARGFGDPAVLASGAFLAALLLGAAVLYRRVRRDPGPRGAAGRVAVLGLVWLLLLLAPTSSLVPLADVMVEHRLYLACWGPFAAASMALWVFLDRASPRAPIWFATVGGFVWVALGLTTFARSTVWASDLALWTDAAEKSPHKSRPRLGIANALKARGETAQSLANYRAALELSANDAPWMRNEIRAKLSAALMAQGHTEDALSLLTAGLREEPAESQLLGLAAFAQLARKEYPTAEDLAARAVSAATDKSLPSRVLALVRLGAGNPGGAKEAVDEAVKRDPDDPQLWILLARADRQLGRGAEACAALRAAIARTSDGQAQADLRAAAGKCPQSAE